MEGVMSASRQWLAAVLGACVLGSAMGQGTGLRADTAPAFGLRGGLDSRASRSSTDVFPQSLSGSADAAVVLADWHPLASGFRLTGGLAYNNVRFETLNYSSRSFLLVPADVPVVNTSSVRSLWARSNPYVGLGWGIAPTPRSGLYMSADVGLMYQRASTAGCSLALPPMLCAQLQNDVRFDEDSRVAPVLSLGVGLRF
jgi:hypothetical protein